MRRFAGIELISDRIPDETTILTELLEPLQDPCTDSTNLYLAHGRRLVET